MCRCFFLLLAGVISVSAFSSCAKPVTTESADITRHNVFLQDMGNGICHQFPTGLMWQIKKSKKMIATLVEAADYVDKLQLAGFDDWRLPTRDECRMLAELLLMKKGDCPIKITKGHWASDNKKPTPGFWDDYPLCGGPEFRWVKTTEGFVRAVRP